MKVSPKEKQEAIAELREYIHPDSVVYLIQWSVSKSGCSRSFAVYAIRDNRPICLTRLVAKATDSSLSKSGDGVIVRGTGMDMGFALVHDICNVLEVPYSSVRREYLT
jgi:hypothetical protein